MRPRQAEPVLEDPVDPEADQDLVLVGLHVNVRGALPERVDEEAVHQADDRHVHRVAQHVLAAQVVDVVNPLHPLRGLVRCDTAQVVERMEQVQDLLLGPQLQVHRKPQRHPKHLGARPRRELRRADDQHPILDPERDDPPGAQHVEPHALRQELRHRGGLRQRGKGFVGGRVHLGGRKGPSLLFQGLRLLQGLRCGHLSAS